MLKNLCVCREKYPHSFPSNIKLQMDHNQRVDAGDQYAKRRPEELIEKYKKIKQTLNHYDNLPNTLKHFSLLSTLQCLGEL